MAHQSCSSTSTTTLNNITYTWPGSQGASYILQTNGSGTLSWVDPGTLPSSNYFTIASGRLYPTNTTLDFGIGGTATSSSKFAVLNVNSGTPTASLSAGSAGGTYLTADGTLTATAMQTLNIGGSTTGAVNIVSGATLGTTVTTGAGGTDSSGTLVLVTVS